MQVRFVLVNRSRQRFDLPPAIEHRIKTAILRGTLAIGSDYDNTMVDTDEVGRVFPPFQIDKSRVIEPFSALMVLGFPAAILTGNKPAYIEAQCTAGLKDWLQDRNLLAAMQNLWIYAQNATWLEVLDENGEIIPDVTDAYAAQYRFPEGHMEILRDTLWASIKVLSPRSDKHMVIRPPGRHEEIFTWDPMFENRGKVMGAWVAVLSEARERVTAEARPKLPPEIAARYRIEPAGQCSIDINWVKAAKNNGTKHFRQNPDGLDRGVSVIGSRGVLNRVLATSPFNHIPGRWLDKKLSPAEMSDLFYFGDSVTVSPNGVEGNDYPVVKDPHAIIFAVNRKQDQIPKHDRIVKAGATPTATRTWLAWLTYQAVTLRFATQHISRAEKVRTVDALIACGVAEQGPNDEVRIAA